MSHFLHTVKAIIYDRLFVGCPPAPTSWCGAVEVLLCTPDDRLCFHFDTCSQSGSRDTKLCTPNCKWTIWGDSTPLTGSEVFWSVLAQGPRQSVRPLYCTAEGRRPENMWESVGGFVVVVYIRFLTSEVQLSDFTKLMCLVRNTEYAALCVHILINVKWHFNHFETSTSLVLVQPMYPIVWAFWRCPTFICRPWQAVRFRKKGEVKEWIHKRKYSCWFVK